MIIAAVSLHLVFLVLLINGFSVDLNQDQSLSRSL